MTRRSVLATRREDLAAMVRAMYRSLRWLAATPGAEIARALQSYFPNVPAEIFAGAMDRYRALNLYGPDPVTRPEGVARLQGAMRSGGALPHDIPFESVVDNSLAEDAVRAFAHISRPAAPP